jgi:hypothetical protein
VRRVSDAPRRLREAPHGDVTEIRRMDSASKSEFVGHSAFQEPS